MCLLDRRSIVFGLSLCPVPPQDKACDAMELFDELVECEVGIVVPHLGPLIQFCLEVASNANLGNNIRVKALSFVSCLATLKKKVTDFEILFFLKFEMLTECTLSQKCLY